jgi:hypothetical protein
MSKITTTLRDPAITAINIYEAAVMFRRTSKREEHIPHMHYKLSTIFAIHL